MKNKYTIKEYISIKDNINKPFEVDQRDEIIFRDGHCIVYNTKNKKKSIKPGNYKLSSGTYSGEVVLKKIQYEKKPLHKNLSSTSFVKKQIEQFFNKFHIYTKRGLIPKRNILLYSSPGYGKTTAITNAIDEFKDENTLVVNWICGSPSEAAVLEWFATEIKYDKKISKMFIVIEDIGGTWENHPVHISALLNLLQGSMNIFTIPTMVIATTNHPEKMLESISNRPRRFDVVAEMPLITNEERYDLLKFYSHEMVEVDKALAMKDKYKKLTIAHLEEAIDKALLEDISLEKSLDSMVQFQDRFNKNFTKKQKLGFSED